MPSCVLRNLSCKTFIQENKGYQTKKKSCTFFFLKYTENVILFLSRNENKINSVHLLSHLSQCYLVLYPLVPHDVSKHDDLVAYQKSVVVMGKPVVLQLSKLQIRDKIVSGNLY